MRHFTTPTLSLLIVTLILVTNSIFADTVYFKNGKSLQGKIVGQTRTNIRLRFNSGKTKIINKTLINKITYNNILKSNTQKQKTAKLKKEKIAREIKRKNRIRAQQLALEKKRKLVTKKGKTKANLKLNALWHSALIPGWGQYINGHKTKGSIWMGSFIVSLFYSANQTISYNSKVNAVKANNNTWNALSFSSDPTIMAYNIIQRKDGLNQVQTKSGQVKNANILVISLYAFNLIDAYFFSSKTRKNKRSKTSALKSSDNGFWLHTSTSLGQNTNKKSYNAGYTFYF